MRKIIYGAVSLIVFLIINSALYSQVSITGPTCVIPGTVYEYTITGNWDTTSTMSLCTNGGAIFDVADSNECTITGPPIARVLVDWDTSGNYSLSLTSTSGNATLHVSVTIPLLPGTIDSVSKTQMIRHDSIPASITCSADMGGYCSPQYNYQWQQSTDLALWTDIQGATGASLSFSDTLKQSLFFRRKVTEINSGNINASDAAAIYIVTRQETDSTQTDSSSTGLNTHQQFILRGAATCINKSSFHLPLERVCRDFSVRLRVSFCQFSRSSSTLFWRRVRGEFLLTNKNSATCI